jgi:hypothetical protein
LLLCRARLCQNCAMSSVNPPGILKAIGLRLWL